MRLMSQGAAESVERPSDTVLWERGDEPAFAELYDRYAEAVWNHAYRLTASWSTAEDLTSGTFLTAWRRRHEIRLVHDSALPWLFTVAANLARTEFRRSSRFNRLLHRVPLNDVTQDHSDLVASSVDDSRRLRQVLDAIATLPRAEREAVELVLLGDISIADAASVLGLAEVSVRASISRAVRACASSWRNSRDHPAASASPAAAGDQGTHAPGVHLRQRFRHREWAGPPPRSC